VSHVFSSMNSHSPTTRLFPYTTLFRSRGTAQLKTENQEPTTFSWHPRLPRTFYYLLFAVTLFSLGNSSDMFLVLRAQNLGIRASQAPLLGLAFNITYTLLSWPAGRLSDRFSKRAMAAAGYAVFAGVY